MNLAAYEAHLLRLGNLKLAPVLVLRSTFLFHLGQKLSPVQLVRSIDTLSKHGINILTV